LVITSGPYSVNQNRFSEQFAIIKRDRSGSRVSFPPQEKIYLATTSGTGHFYRYPVEEALLPGLLQSQQIGENRTQVLSSWGSEEESFYYKDSSIGTYKLYASLDPTINDQDAFAIITVTKFTLEELEEELEELEPVEDESGRTIEKIELTPTFAKTLPEGIIKFQAQAYDTEGEIIENAIFAWFVVGGGGKALSSGLEEDSSTTLFTAGEELGIFENTLLVATLYNGKVESASASVAVVDLLALAKPGTLPSTGPNGLQLLLITITLLAAVALAWVEHYERTYLREEK